MSALNKIETEKPSGLALMRAPFPENCISKLPKPTKKQTDEVRADFKKGIRCQICGGWHHPQVVHLDYVGHAALTDRLLACDPEWNWEPANGDPVPTMDEHGGMWIKLTVCGVTRLGYGHSDGKRGGDAIKETIGDALRNAAMRFGAALDLWHKGQLHDDGEVAEKPAEKAPEPPKQEKPAAKSQYETIADDMIVSIREYGWEPVWNDPRFQAAFKLLKSSSPDLAAMVEAEIETKKANDPNPYADIDYQKEDAA